MASSLPSGLSATHAESLVRMFNLALFGESSKCLALDGAPEPQLFAKHGGRVRCSGVIGGLPGLDGDKAAVLAGEASGFARKKR